jgi:hypothetical protein
MRTPDSADDVFSGYWLKLVRGSALYPLGSGPPTSTFNIGGFALDGGEIPQGV